MNRRFSSRFTRRAALLTGALALSSRAFGQTPCLNPLRDHVKGPPVWRDLDQFELDAAYRQEDYQPHIDEVTSRLSAASYEFRERRGYPKRGHYGEGRDEGVDIYQADATNAPVFIFIHGGTWRSLNAAGSGFAAEPFLDRGVHFAALDFSDVRFLEGDLSRMADQVRRGIAWVVRNARSFGGDPDRVFIGGHSSGGHLAAVALTTDWAAFGLPADTVKAGLCISGIYDLAPVRLSWRSSYLALTEEIEDAMSPLRHLDRIAAPITLAYGTLETPEFQRQAEDFAGALNTTRKPVTLNVGQHLYHQDTWETLGNPYGLSGRAAFTMMEL